MLGLIPHFMNGTHIDREPVTMTRARRVRITSADEMVAHVDGEVLFTDGHEITCEILPQRLRVKS
jgi:diacylglycerol kinase family enzyme